MEGHLLRKFIGISKYTIVDLHREGLCNVPRSASKEQLLALLKLDSYKVNTFTPRGSKIHAE